MKLHNPLMKDYKWLKRFNGIKDSKGLLSVLLSLLFILPAFADHPYRDHRFYSYKSLPECKPGDILFVGNSITNMMNWWEAFGSRDNIRGRGNSGATSDELLYYFDDIVKGEPSKVFLMIGTNDLASDTPFNSPDSVADRIIRFLERTRLKVPAAEIYYQSILPSLSGRRSPEKIERVNRIVADWIAERKDPKMVYINLYTPFADEKGGIKNTVPAPDPAALSYDGLHLTQQGYKLWLDLIKDYVGYQPVYGEPAENLAGGMGGSNAMRTSYFGALPVKSSDILLISADELIHNGEWQERLGNTDIKDRGIGWGFPGMPIGMMEGAFDPILNGNTDKGVTKETPRAVAFYGGSGEVWAGWNADSLYAAYTHAIGLLREKLPSTPIFAMTLLPMAKSQKEKNQVIDEFNEKVRNELVNPADNILLIDFNAAVGGSNRNEDYFMKEESPYVNDKGYAVLAAAIANELKGFNALSDYALLPLPQQIVFGKGQVNAVAVSVSSQCWQNRIPDILSNLNVNSDDPKALKVVCTQEPDMVISSLNNDEAYKLTIDEEGVKIAAATERGIYWGLVTLNQLAEPSGRKNSPGKSGGEVLLPVCEIVDWPAFSIRGFLNDTGRSFISIEELKAEIDAMSRFKLNVFHWHLTENQGWRLESKIYPELNDPANMLRDHGKFYRIEEAKELVRYAAERNIMVIPETDMPGHSKAFEMTFGFDMQSPEGMEILKKLVTEACETFAEVPYYHIGTDEVQFTNPDFVPEMVELVRSHGKKVISWNPGWQYKPGEVDMVQMWSYRGKPIEGVPAVDSRFHYINHFDTYGDIVALYRSNVYGREKEDDTVKGLILGLWNDRFIDDESKIAVQNNLYPLLMATAERGWDGGGTEYFDLLGTNMAEPGSADFRDFADFERRMLFHKSSTLADKIIPYVKQTNVNWLITSPFPNGGDLEAVFPPESEGPKAEYVYNDSIYKSRNATGAGIYLRHVWGNTIPAFYENPQPDHTAYAFTNVYSPEERTVGLQFETQNYSRSEPDLPAPQGKWDFRDSKLWINGKLIEPREWENSHTTKDNEISLKNENMAVGETIPVELNKGWNTVMIKLPVGKFQTPEVRLVKWMFTFNLTTPDGKSQAPDLIFAPII